jgi:hypothetical protein
VSTSSLTTLFNNTYGTTIILSNKSFVTQEVDVDWCIDQQLLVIDGQIFRKLETEFILICAQLH